ncbi:MAG: response regulator transcription factor [Anaerolineae bacterium]
MRALLISQDPDETAVLAMVLQRAGLNVTRSREVPSPIPQTEDDPVNLIVLATTEGSPLPAVKGIRAESHVPLMLISEQLDEATHAVALESGADLVVLRPFSARLLIAQTRALLRRAANLPFFTLPTLTAEDVELDPATRTVVVGKRSPKRLTQLEFRLLYTLMIHKEQVLPTEVLIEHVWGYTGEGERDLLRGLVRRLRIKVEPDPRHPQYVITVPGVGYTFSPEG